MGCGASNQRKRNNSDTAPHLHPLEPSTPPSSPAARRWKSCLEDTDMVGAFYGAAGGDEHPNQLVKRKRTLRRQPQQTVDTTTPQSSSLLYRPHEGKNFTTLGDDGGDLPVLPCDAEQDTNPPPSATVMSSCATHASFDGDDGAGSSLDGDFRSAHAAKEEEEEEQPPEEDAPVDVFPLAQVASFISQGSFRNGASSLTQHHHHVQLMRGESNNSLASLTNATAAKETHCASIGRNDRGEKCVNAYTFLHELGRGRQGKVKLAEESITKQLVAVKIVNKCLSRRRGSMCSRQELTLLASEIEIMKRLRHRNVVRLFEVIDDANANKMYVVMQYVDRGPIFQLDREGNCPKHSEDEVRETFRQVVRGLLYLHRRNILHRDIKPDNVLMDSHRQVYLSDFGVSGLLDFQTGRGPSLLEGTPAFHSPEMVEGRGASFGKESDTWALGVTMFAMLYGTLPFKGDRVALCKSILEDEPPIPTESAPPDEIDLFRRLLHKHPERRMTLMELRHNAWLRVGYEEEEFSSPCGSCLSFPPDASSSFSPSCGSSSASPVRGSHHHHHQQQPPLDQRAFSFGSGGGVIPMVVSMSGSPQGSLIMGGGGGGAMSSANSSSAHHPPAVQEGTGERAILG